MSGLLVDQRLDKEESEQLSILFYKDHTSIESRNYAEHMLECQQGKPW